MKNCTRSQRFSLFLWVPLHLGFFCLSVCGGNGDTESAEPSHAEKSTIEPPATNTLPTRPRELDLPAIWALAAGEPAPVFESRDDLDFNDPERMRGMFSTAMRSDHFRARYVPDLIMDLQRMEDAFDHRDDVKLMNEIKEAYFSDIQQADYFYYTSLQQRGSFNFDTQSFPLQPQDDNREAVYETRRMHRVAPNVRNSPETLRREQTVLVAGTTGTLRSIPVRDIELAKKIEQNRGLRLRVVGPVAELERKRISINYVSYNAFVPRLEVERVELVRYPEDIFKGSIGEVVHAVNFNPRAEAAVEAREREADSWFTALGNKAHAFQLSGTPHTILLQRQGTGLRAALVSLQFNNEQAHPLKVIRTPPSVAGPSLIFRTLIDEGTSTIVRARGTQDIVRGEFMVGITPGAILDTPLPAYLSAVDRIEPLSFYQAKAGTLRRLTDPAYQSKAEAWLDFIDETARRTAHVFDNEKLNAVARPYFALALADGGSGSTVGHETFDGSRTGLRDVHHYRGVEAGIPILYEVTDAPMPEFPLESVPGPGGQSISILQPHDGFTPVQVRRIYPQPSQEVSLTDFPMPPED